MTAITSGHTALTGPALTGPALTGPALTAAPWAGRVIGLAFVLTVALFLVALTTL